MAVAITLLALGIDAPTPEPGESLLQAFDAQTLGAIGLFALSFFLIARFWLVHHRLFAGLPSMLDPGFVVLNFAFLAMICLVPFATTTSSAGCKKSGVDTRERFAASPVGFVTWCVELGSNPPVA